MIGAGAARGAAVRTVRPFAARPVVVGLALVLALAGCGGSGDREVPPESPAGPTTEPKAPKSDPPAMPTADPTPEPTTEPDVDPHPAIGDLVITTSGLGPLTVGLPPEGNPGAAMIEWDEAWCAGEGWDGSGDPGRWVPSGYGSDVGYHGGEVPVFYVDGEPYVWRIDVMGVGPATLEGVRIGTSLVDLRATYPALAGPYEGPVSQVWWLQDESGYLVFETQGGDLIAPGAPEQVILIRVLSPEADPAFATANSGDVAGACF